MDAHYNINSTESFLDYVLQAVSRELEDARHLQQVLQLHCELQPWLSIPGWFSMDALIEKVFMYEMLVNQMKRTITDLEKR